jgi:hypothetical protein
VRITEITVAKSGQQFMRGVETSKIGCERLKTACHAKNAAKTTLQLSISTIEIRPKK